MSADFVNTMIFGLCDKHKVWVESPQLFWKIWACCLAGSQYFKLNHEWASFIFLVIFIDYVFNFCCTSTSENVVLLVINVADFERPLNLYYCVFGGIHDVPSNFFFIDAEWGVDPYYAQLAHVYMFVEVAPFFLRDFFQKLPIRVHYVNIFFDLTHFVTEIVDRIELGHC